MTDWTKCSAVESNPRKISGDCALTGARASEFARLRKPREWSVGEGFS